VQARCTTGSRAIGITKTVRRMPSIRAIRRSAYSASSTASTVADGTRARADRYTVTGSVACSATMASVAAATVAAGAPS